MRKLIRIILCTTIFFTLLFYKDFSSEVFAEDQCTECGCDDNACKYEGKSKKACECFGPQPCVEVGYMVSCGGGGGGTPPPEYETIAGFVNDMTTFSPIPKVNILIKRQDDEVKTVATDNSGYFEQKNFIEKGQLYDVKIIGSDYKWSTDKAVTNTPGWSWDNCTNPNPGSQPWSDTSNGSTAYLCQKAGSNNDCAGPDGDGNQKRCNFLLPEYLQTTVDLMENNSNMCNATTPNGQLWLGEGDVNLGDYALQIFTTNLSGSILDTKSVYTPNQVGSNAISSPFNSKLSLQNLNQKFTRNYTNKVCVGTGITFLNHNFESGDLTGWGPMQDVSANISNNALQNYSLRLNLASDGNSPYDPYLVSEEIETSQAVAGKTFTLSLYAKTQTNTTTSGIIGLQVMTHNPAQETINLDDKWRYFNFKYTVPNNYPGQKIRVVLRPSNNTAILFDAVNVIRGTQIQENALSDIYNYDVEGGQSKIVRFAVDICPSVPKIISPLGGNFDPNEIVTLVWQGYDQENSANYHSYYKKENDVSWTEFTNCNWNTTNSQMECSLDLSILNLESNQKVFFKIEETTCDNVTTSDFSESEGGTVFPPIYITTHPWYQIESGDSYADRISEEASNPYVIYDKIPAQNYACLNDSSCQPFYNTNSGFLSVNTVENTLSLGDEATLNNLCKNSDSGCVAIVEDQYQDKLYNYAYWSRLLDGKTNVAESWDEILNPGSMFVVEPIIPKLTPIESTFSLPSIWNFIKNLLSLVNYKSSLSSVSIVREKKDMVLGVATENGGIFTYDGSSIPTTDFSGKQIVVISNQDININGNININKNTGGAFVLITSGIINISPSVTRLDGYYIADGRINTGSTNFEDQQLIISGGLISWNKVLLQRTLSSQDNAKKPAELFIQRPDIMKVLFDSEVLKPAFSGNHTWQEVSP